MSIVHSCADTQTAKRVMGGLLRRLRPRQSASRARAAAFATPAGTDLSGISTPCVATSAVRNSRNTTGSPSVTK
jgi:hypothetical protein